MSLEEEIRDLVRQLIPKEVNTLRLQQGVVISIQIDDTLTLTVAGGQEEVPGFQYLLDGYSPIVGDVVWILDSGPGSRFVIGTTNRP